MILTKNEALHIERALASVAHLGAKCLVVDSGSTDATLALAEAAGACVLHHPWVNYASQFNWALEQLPAGCDWVLRLDADEIVSPALADEIRERLPSMPDEVEGIYISRHMRFQGRDIIWGGVFPIRVLRLFRAAKGRCENRWMDEHIQVSGKTAEFQGGVLDDNLNPLTWWVDKHNAYANREVVDLLNLEYGFMPHETVADLGKGQQAGVKRWIKEALYARLPGGFRAFAYFTYRYVLRLGFLDGKEGTAFHVLQGFWYRYLVDVKLREVKRHMRRHNTDVETAMRDVLQIDLATASVRSVTKAQR